MARALLLVGATLVGGCSFVLVDKYRDPPPGAPVACTSSYTAPIADAVITALGAAGAIYAIATNDTTDDKGDPGRAALAGFGSITAVVFGVSGTIGAVRVHECRSEKQRFGP